MIWSNRYWRFRFELERKVDTDAPGYSVSGGRPTANLLNPKVLMAQTTMAAAAAVMVISPNQEVPVTVEVLNL